MFFVDVRSRHIVGWRGNTAWASPYQVPRRNQHLLPLHDILHKISLTALLLLRSLNYAPPPPLNCLLILLRLVRAVLCHLLHAVFGRSVYRQGSDKSFIGAQDLKSHPSQSIEARLKMSSLEKAFPKPGIELYSGKYFAACGLGGIIGSYKYPKPRILHARR